MEDWRFWSISVSVILLIISMIPGINKPILWLFGKPIPAGLHLMGLILTKWTIWVGHKMVRSHSILIKNLTRPRSAIYPSVGVNRNDQHK